MEPDESHQSLGILDHVRPRRPARQVLLIPVRRTIRDDKTDDDAFEEDSSSFSGTEVELWLGRTQHGQHYVRDSQVNMRAQRDCRDGYHAYHASVIIRGKPRLSIPVAKRVCSNTAGHILQNYLPRLCQETENINDDYIPQYRYQTSMQRV